MRFLAVFGIAAWMPHVSGDLRWVVLAAFGVSLGLLLRGIKT
jgi:hypothetical protein